MESLHAIYTKEIDCRSCNKCIRECHTRAITYENNHARILQDKCIYGGRCTIICPAHANKVRDDIELVKDLLLKDKKYIVSLDQSYLSDFPDLDHRKLIKAIKKLGFYEVSETSIGMQEVVGHLKDLLSRDNKGIFLLSSCPTIHMLINKYYPELNIYLTPFQSHFLTHANIIKKKFGEDIGVVYIGSCVSVKVESDDNKDKLEATLTFKNLRTWFENEGIDPYNIEIEDCEIEDFVPYKYNGSLEYSVVGGVKDELQRTGEFNHFNFMKYSSIKDVKKALDGILSLEKKGNFFLELFACPGGCIYGPGSRDDSISVKEGQIVLNMNSKSLVMTYDKELEDIRNRKVYEPVPIKHHEEGQLTSALTFVGIYTKEDEIDCGGCGFYTCREFAEAMLDGMAKPTMCTQFTKKILDKFKRKDKELKDNLHLHQEIIDSVPVPIFYRNGDGVFLGCNRSYEELRGLSRDQIIGKSFYDIYSKKDAELSEKMDKILLNDKKLQIYEHSTEQYGQSKHLVYNKAAFRNVYGDAIGIVGAIFDITERKTVRLELEKAKEIAELSVSLLKEIPAGIVLVDENMKIVDCNKSFAKTAGNDIVELFDFNPGLEGADIDKIVDFHKYFTMVLQNGENIVGKDIEINGKLFDVSFYTIRKNKVVGAVIVDMTNPVTNKEEIIERTEEVIRRNLETVHQVAYLLGENAAKTEDMLGSLIKIYKNIK
ncbi:MAG: PAS domain S-box protein [Candidatus Delongbacteria bacterium]|nr:PAS domain S-box protein [Candidatus Delongbacteria bacterium]MBN2836825.1 PAS domain S-box protein [Candidatus Delongbacteria bacterium]